MFKITEKFENWSDKEDKKDNDYLDTSIELEKWFYDPESKKIWSDITKDLSFGNIEQWEHQAILNQEKTYRGLLGMKMAIGNEKISKLFIPDELLRLYQRMPFFTLTLSLSKSGFLQKIRRLIRKEQEIRASGITEEGINYKRGWLWNKKKNQG